MDLALARGCLASGVSSVPAGCPSPDPQLRPFLQPFKGMWTSHCRDPPIGSLDCSIVDHVNSPTIVLCTDKVHLDYGGKASDIDRIDHSTRATKGADVRAILIGKSRQRQFGFSGINSLVQTWHPISTSRYSRLLLLTTRIPIQSDTLPHTIKFIMAEGGCLCGAIRVKSTGEIKTKVSNEYPTTQAPSSLLLPGGPKLTP